MPDSEKEMAALKAENKKLKVLLMNAIQLLHQSKEIILHTGQPTAKSGTKKTAKSGAKTSVRGRHWPGKTG